MSGSKALFRDAALKHGLAFDESPLQDGGHELKAARQFDRRELICVFQGRSRCTIRDRQADTEMDAYSIDLNLRLQEYFVVCSGTEKTTADRMISYTELASQLVGNEIRLEGYTAINNSTGANYIHSIELLEDPLQCPDLVWDPRGTVCVASLANDGAWGASVSRDQYNAHDNETIPTNVDQTDPNNAAILKVLYPVPTEGTCSIPSYELRPGLVATRELHVGEWIRTGYGEAYWFTGDGKPRNRKPSAGIIELYGSDVVWEAHNKAKAHHERNCMGFGEIAFGAKDGMRHQQFVVTNVILFGLIGLAFVFLLTRA